MRNQKKEEEKTMEMSFRWRGLYITPIMYHCIEPNFNTLEEIYQSMNEKQTNSASLARTWMATIIPQRRPPLNKRGAGKLTS